MDEKKQIEEMAKDICSKYTICTCNDRNGRCSTPRQHARIMYELGYRKQREAEWIYQEYSMGHYVGKCNLCECEADMTRYCPNCGARMKGV